MSIEITIQTDVTFLVSRGSPLYNTSLLELFNGLLDTHDLASFLAMNDDYENIVGNYVLCG